MNGRHFAGAQNRGVKRGLPPGGAGGPVSYFLQGFSSGG